MKHTTLFIFLYFIISFDLIAFDISFQNFDDYPDKKGAWYNSNIENFEFRATNDAAFQSEKGLEIIGQIKGSHPIAKIPLNPNQSASRLHALFNHQLKLMIRSNISGIISYIFIDSNGNKFQSPWVKFYSSSKGKLENQNHSGLLSLNWEKNWQSIKFASFKPNSKFTSLDGKHIKPIKSLKPIELSIKLARSEGHQIKIHVDEINLSSQILLKEMSKYHQETPLYHFPQYHHLPYIYGQFSPSENWKINTDIDSISHHTFYDNSELNLKLKSLDSKAKTISLTPQHPIIIGTDRGVLALKLSLKSNGINDSYITFNFRETQRSKQRNDSETFMAQYPLNFIGNHTINIPLTFNALSIRDEYRKHNKTIDGSLILESMDIILNSSKSNSEHHLIFKELTQITNPNIWDNHTPHLQITDYKFPQLKDFKYIKSSGFPLRDMNKNSFYATIEKSSSISDIEVRHNKNSAIYGSHGAYIDILTKEYEGTHSFILKLTKVNRNLIEKNGFDECQFGLNLISTHQGEIALSLLDAKGELYLTPYYKFRAYPTLMKNYTLSNSDINKSLILFNAIKRSNLHNLHGIDHRNPIKFPITPYSFHFKISPQSKNTKNINIRLDNFHYFNQYNHTTFQRSKTLNTQSYSFFKNELNPDPLFTSLNLWGIGRLSGLGKELSSTSYNSLDNYNYQNKLKDVQLSYNNAQNKFNQLKELNPKTELNISHFFKDSSKKEQIAPLPQIKYQNIDNEGLKIHILWPKQNIPVDYLKWGRQEVFLKSFSHSYNNQDIPIHKGIYGIKIKIHSSDSDATYLKIIMEDNHRRKYLKLINLGFYGNRVFDIPFNQFGFETNANESKKMTSLKLTSISLVHCPGDNETDQELYFALYEPNFLVSKDYAYNYPEAFKRFRR